MQKELLGHARCSSPVRGQLAHLGFRRQAAVEVGSTDRFADPQVTGHDARTPQRTRQKPLGCPAAEATTRRQTGDDLGIWLVTERF